MKLQIAGLALIFGTDVEDEDRRQRWRQLSNVTISNDLERIGLVNGYDQIRSLKGALQA
jgi:hypothetical protein